MIFFCLPVKKKWKKNNHKYNKLYISVDNGQRRKLPSQPFSVKFTRKAEILVRRLHIASMYCITILRKIIAYTEATTHKMAEATIRLLSPFECISFIPSSLKVPLASTAPYIVSIYCIHLSELKLPCQASLRRFVVDKGPELYIDV
jgi:hypothetical protein